MWSARLVDLSSDPGLEGGHELSLVDDAVLKRQQSEEQIAISGHLHLRRKMVIGSFR